MSSTLQRKQRHDCHNRCLQYRPRNSFMATAKQRRFKPIAFASRYLNDAEKIFCRRIELLAVVWGLELFRFNLYGQQVQLFSDHQALEPPLKKNKINEQYSARLTRWLDRLNHFDITLKYTARKEIKFTEFIS